jgi:hypothetical protein
VGWTGAGATKASFQRTENLIFDVDQDVWLNRLAAGRAWSKTKSKNRQNPKIEFCNVRILLDN